MRSRVAPALPSEPGTSFRTRLLTPTIVGMVEQEPAPNAPAGWYPEGVNGMRFWDGKAWTDQRAPNPRPSTPSRNAPAVTSLVLALLGIIPTFLGNAVLAGVGLFLLFIGLLFGLDGMSKARRTHTGGGIALAGVIVAGLPLLLFAIYTAVRSL